MAEDSIMTPLQAAIWEFLRSHYAGPENAAPRAAIIARFNLMHDPRFEVEDRVFRRIVSDLVTVFKKAICTTPSLGYFVARTLRERDEAIRDLGSKVGAIAQRMRALEAADPLERQERLF